AAPRRRARRRCGRCARPNGPRAPPEPVSRRPAVSLVYLGTSSFAAAVLERLASEERRRPALVVTRPDRPSGRGRRVSSPPVADTARQLGLALAQPPRVNDPDAVEEIVQAAAAPPGPAHVVVCAFGALIGERLLAA